MTNNAVPPAKNISVRLKVLRAEYGWTQAEIAGKLGISQQMYSKYESGNTVLDADMVKKVCEVYGISADYLLGIEPTGKSVAQQQVAYETTDENIDLIVEKVLSRMKKTNL